MGSLALWQTGAIMPSTHPLQSVEPETRLASGQNLLRGSAALLVAISWISAAAFGLYILTFYLGALHSGDLVHWNDNLPGLYDTHHHAAFLAIAAHMAVGALILILGPVQLLGALRRKRPGVHRWIGRLYVLSGFLAGLGGLIFILTKGTIGGGAMNAGFGLYGLLMVVASVQTYRKAVVRQFQAHRAWALRLFALAIGSWLYRMDYGFWLLAAHGIGHTSSFHGPFDAAMAFLFYLPNLAVVEIYLRAGKMPRHVGVRLLALTAVNLATLTVAVGTYYFVRFYWGPAIVHGMRL
jgi:hypothetical protein